uniref:Neurturin n=1 Tax=Sinocyclocheilus grahami TaxID=75366 RepID=A0A672RCU3_SINGR
TQPYLSTAMFCRCCLSLLFRYYSLRHGLLIGVVHRGGSLFPLLRRGGLLPRRGGLLSEGELKQVIGTLVDRKARRDAQQSKRTKRAKKRAKPCSLREVEVTVSQLGLGYVSDETIVFHYCSGKCTTSRKNYDLTLAFMKRSRLLTKYKKDKARHSPCCRPTAYEEDISFLDNFNKYHTIQEFSAKACGCI